MAAQLNAQGFIGWMSASVVDAISGLGLTWQPAFAMITAIYFYSHYFFASGAAHIGAMYTAFLAVAQACGTPGVLAALLLGQLSNLVRGRRRRRRLFFCRCAPRRRFFFALFLPSFSPSFC